MNATATISGSTWKFLSADIEYTLSTHMATLNLLVYSQTCKCYFIHYMYLGNK